MIPNRIFILSCELDMGRKTITERIHEILEKQNRERGAADRPELVFYNPSAEADREAISALLAETAKPHLIVVDCPPERITHEELLAAVMKERPMPIFDIKLPEPTDMAAISKKLQTELPRKKTGHEKANPNQPFYAKFGKKPKRNRRR